MKNRNTIPSSPEPATLGLVGFAAIGLLVVRRFLTV